LSTAIDVCPSKPPGFGPDPEVIIPSRITSVAKSQITFSHPFCAFEDLLTTKLNPFEPPIYNSPSGETSSVPQ